jgi:hypothetical protein
LRRGEDLAERKKPGAALASDRVETAGEPVPLPLHAETVAYRLFATSGER